MLLRAISCGALALILPAQTPQASNPASGEYIAKQAPLTDAEREELSRAVAARNYLAEKAVLDRAAAENPQSAEVQVLAGRVAFLSRQPKDAAEAFERAAKIKPLTADDRASLALAYEGIGMKKEALATVSRLTTDLPKNPEYWYLKGRIELHFKNNEAAIGDFRQAITVDPANVRAYLDLGTAQDALGHAEAARQSYEAAARLNRHSPSPFDTPPLRLGELLLKANELDAAEKLFDEALRYRPRSAWAHYDLAQLEIRRDKRDSALAEYRAAVVNDPTLRQAWLALGREYTRSGQKAEADKCLAMFKKLEDAQKARTQATSTDPSTGNSQAASTGKTP